MLIEIENLTEHVLSEIDLTEKLLALLEDDLVDPLVAGGAPRDWFFDRLSNDIDIFIRNDEESFKAIHERLKRVPLLQRLSIKTTDQLPESYRSDNIDGVITFHFEFKTFQIICLKSNVEDFIAGFPCSICQISYKDFVLRPRTEFMSSVRRQYLQFNDNASPPYISKIRSYFPNWQYSGGAGVQSTRGMRATAMWMDEVGIRRHDVETEMLVNDTPF